MGNSQQQSTPVSYEQGHRTWQIQLTGRNPITYTRRYSLATNYTVKIPRYNMSAAARKQTLIRHYRRTQGHRISCEATHGIIKHSPRAWLNTVHLLVESLSPAFYNNC